MPELPEVESLRRSLEPYLISRRIVSTEILRRDVLILPGDPEGGFSRSRRNVRPRRASPDHVLQGLRIASLCRRGKQLAILTNEGPALIVHLGMTGQLLLNPANGLGHVHLAWTLDDGTRLVFRDPRRFGYVRVLSFFDGWPGLGPDALGASADQLQTTSRRALKALLLDQVFLAGIGNIYADESLFRAGLSPRRRAGSLTVEQRTSLAAAIQAVLNEAIRAGGSTLRDYRDASGKAGEAQFLHRVYGRSGLPCTSCGKPLVSMRIAQRTTVLCRRCQH